MKPETIARKIGDYFSAEMFKHKPGSPMAKEFSNKALASMVVELVIKKPSLIKDFKISATLDSGSTKP